MRTQIFLSAAIAVLPLLLWGAPKLQVTAERPSAVYQPGEEIAFQIRLTDGDKPLAGQKLNVTLRGDRAVAGSSMLVTGDNGTAVVKVTPKQPTVIHCIVSGAKKLNATGGAVVSPEKIQPGMPEPKDFEAFWEQEKKEIASLPDREKQEPARTRSKALRAFGVELNMADGEAPAYGYLTLPANAKAKSLPAHLIVHGAGTYQVIPVEKPDRITFTLNPHSLPNGKDRNYYQNERKTTLADYRRRDGEDHKKVYFRGMYRRLLRALKFLKSRPEWDGRILIVSGTSQGGGQTLVAAGLDPQVSCIVAHVPALCDLGALKAGRVSGWPQYVADKKYQSPKAREKVQQETAYIDAVNFARRIKNPVCLLSTGFIDTTCCSSSVYAAYNVIPAAEKQIICTVDATHKVAPQAREKGEKMIAEYLKKNAAKPQNNTK